MTHISEAELNIMLSYVRDYDVIRLDKDMPDLKERSKEMEKRLAQAYANIYGPFHLIDELILDKIADYAEPNSLENLDRAALNLSGKSEFMKEKIGRYIKENPFMCENCFGRCKEWWQMVEHTNIFRRPRFGKYCILGFPDLSENPKIFQIELERRMAREG